MTYTKRKFGAELILKLEEALQFNRDLDVHNISHWAYEISWDIYDKDFNDILQNVIAMDAGPEFELTKEELLKIAIDCITAEKPDNDE